MPIDEKKFNAIATRGDVAGVALQTSMVAGTLVQCLLKIQGSSGADLEKELSIIKTASERLDAIFDDLTGWTEG